ncbi:PrsW family glutamic-type intramembrane protease [Streptomyces sp. 71268]|uniref:PrsW family glutamic-type intramembrane protease n=1 Tax=Streptomyces sp. 71268 TaxID=3002640 RepID=UPI0023F7C92D|nr:PrsW family glutamic-type intramembrane protease [Streptomyces sp. 71268]WEV26206.1 PrsW family glutamic-type intramembrane protease [Streptomyces sp. 71268]
MRHSRALRAAALIVLLSLSGLVILALVREQTGTEGFLVGLGLAILPVPLLVAAFRWADGVEPKPWRNLLFAFAWGSCAATLVALLANSLATDWLMTTVVESSSADRDTWGATLVAPVVEETAKAAAVLLLFLYRRRDFNGVVDGVVIAGITATGFAFTENILYLGNAFVSDQEFGYSGLQSTTAATFFIRAVMSPFAHPLFTAVTGIGFGIAAARPLRQRTRRVLIPIAGLLLSMVLHGAWNGSASMGGYGFLAVYGLCMVPLFALLTWFTIWSRGKELRTIRAQLPAYQATGWITPPEPVALSSMRARAIARDLARRTRGPAAARAVADYIASATSLAFLRHRAYRGTAGPDFPAREQALLDRLWQHRDIAQPALAHAALSVPTAPPPRQCPYGLPPGYAYLPAAPLHGPGPVHSPAPIHGPAPAYGWPLPTPGPPPRPGLASRRPRTGPRLGPAPGRTGRPRHPDWPGWPRRPGPVAAAPVPAAVRGPAVGNVDIRPAGAVRCPGRRRAGRAPAGLERAAAAGAVVGSRSARGRPSGDDAGRRQPGG